MRRLYEAPAYDPAWPKSHWRASHPAPFALPTLEGEATADIAVIGAGFAGLNAALEAARESGARVVVLDAVQPGWGRIGGATAGFAAMVARNSDAATSRVSAATGPATSETSSGRPSPMSAR